MSWVGWLGRSGLPVVSFQDQCQAILKKGGLPCFSIRWSKDQEDDHFIVQFVNEDGSYNGASIKDLKAPSVGQRVLRDEYVERMSLVAIDSVLTKNGTDVTRLYDCVRLLAQTLPYDTKVCVLTLAGGEPVWVKGAFNFNEAGFSAERAYNHPDRANAIQAVFITWDLVPYYNGTFWYEYVQEPVVDFVYHGWMYDRISDNAKAKLAKDLTDKIRHNLGSPAYKPTLTQRLEANIENRKLLDKELAEIIQLMKKPHVHE
jgi:hypothetical protein